MAAPTRSAGLVRWGIISTYDDFTEKRAGRGVVAVGSISEWGDDTCSKTSYDITQLADVFAEVKIESIAHGYPRLGRRQLRIE
jgi:hypothetical protein